MDKIARRYGIWIFGSEIKEMMKNPIQRIILEEMMGGIKDTGKSKEYWDTLRNYFDILGTNLMNIQGKKLKNDIKSIFVEEHGDGKRVIGKYTYKGKRVRIIGK